MPTLEQIEALLNDTPGDPFLMYALAMELDNRGQHPRSLRIFEELIQQQPPYVPAFFMAGQQLARLDRCDEACAILQAGIVQAKIQNDQHAAGEMADFLENLSP